MNSNGIDIDMEIDTDRLDDAALAILTLTLHDGSRVWKGLAWEITDRLHEKGLIEDPRNRNKSLYLTGEGLERAKTAMRTMFERHAEDRTDRSAGSRGDRCQ